MPSLAEQYLLLFRQMNQVLPITPPVASFTVLNDYASSVLKVNFTDTSTNTPTSWAWNFGDGNTSTSQNPTHTYAAAGHYDVTLTATNAGGSSAPVVVSVPVNAFEAALIAAGASLIYQLRATSGTTAVNTGSDGAGGNGTISGTPTLGVADATGNPDAFVFATGGDTITFPTKILGSFTVLVLSKPNFTDSAAFTVSFSDSVTTDGGQFSINANTVGTGFNAIVFDGTTFIAQQLYTADDYLTVNQLSLTAYRYNHLTGAGALRFSSDGTLLSPALALDDNNPLTPPLSAINADTFNASLTYKTTPSDDITVSAIAVFDYALNDAALSAIAESIWP